MGKLDHVMEAAELTESPAKRGRPVGDREAKRNELLAAGIKVLADVGYAGASLRKVAKEAGYTTGAVTYYFENKDALTAAIVDYLFDEFDRMLMIGHGLTGIKERYKLWLALNADSDKWLAGFQLLARARHDPALAHVYETRYSQFRAVTAHNLRQLQIAGEVRDDISAEVLADLAGAVGDGWMLMLPIEPNRFAHDRVETLLDSFLAMLSPPERSL